jgi:O-antigen/teichoic acid export membrane protein
MIRALLGRLMPKGRFARRVTMLSGGTLLGQLALIASSPILTRLYTPEEFGVLAVFAAISSMLGQVMALRYEFAVPVCRKEEDAAAVAWVGCVVTLLLTALLALVLAFYDESLANLFQMPGHAGLLWLLLPFLLLWGLGLVLTCWSVRRGAFRINAMSNAVFASTQAVSQVGLGFLGGGAVSLVAGHTVSSVTRFMVLLPTLSAADRVLLRRVGWRRVAAAAREHWHYPVYAGSSSLLQSAATMLPQVLVAMLYGPAAAGLFGLGQRITGIPVRMLGEAGSHAFLGEIAQAEGPALYRLFNRTTIRFLALGLLGMSPLLVAGPALFAFVFGEPWRQTGAIVQLLVPLHLARFVVVPVSQTLNVLGHQRLALAASVLIALALGLAFALAAWLSLPLLTAVLLYSAASCLAFLFYLGAAWHVARQAAGGAAARPVPERAGPTAP